VQDISLHILDIAENSVRADAKNIKIRISRDRAQDLFTLTVIDDGRGMDAETLARVRDPFFSTKQKKTGLGIPFLIQAAEQANGKVTVDSVPGKGTEVKATFGWTHVDRPPIGNIAETILTLIAGHPDREYIYEERDGERVFRFDTREIKADLEEIPISDPSVMKAVGDLLRENIGIRE
jgi:hypothetical protein